jgi:ABC-type branched-subunit amino acid transport system ATPase component
LREICQGLTVLLVDHDVAFISQFADYICCLEQGKFTDVGSPAELASRPGLFQILLEENAFYLKGPGIRKSTSQKSADP